MKRIGLTHERYLRLTDTPARVVADEVKTTESAAGELRSRGYEATPDVLKSHVRRGEIEASEFDGKQPAWTRKRIERAANVLEQACCFTSDAAFLRDRDLTMADSQDALEAAYASAIDEFGSKALAVLRGKPIDEFQFAMTIEPVHAKHPARISFALLAEVREEIESKGKPAPKPKSKR